MDLVADILVNAGLLTDSDLRGSDSINMAWVEKASETGKLSRPEALQALADSCGMGVYRPGQDVPMPNATACIRADFAWERRVVPLRLADGILTVIVCDPLDVDLLDDIGHITGQAVEPLLAFPGEFIRLLAAVYAGSVVDAPSPQATATEVEPKPELPPEGMLLDTKALSEEEGPIIRLVEKLIREALRRRASDIHLEPLEHRFRIRFRVDGRLQTIEYPPKRLQASVISRLKLMAEMSIAEKRLPQDGRIRARALGKDIDLRVSCLPGVFGETIVMRILDKEGLKLGLSELGFFSDDAQAFEHLVTLPDGMLLVTGPTGSGKSTTLYAALHHINRIDRKIITVEDPVEYQVSGINQVQVRREIGMTFASALRAILRQAPNIIMVGEIRDAETADIAINASLTGHMVFSTLHTNDAPSAVARLVDIGVKPFLLAASLRGVLAQRLVRRICPECGEAATPKHGELLALGISSEQAGHGSFRAGAGCLSCHGRGFKGRLGLFELLRIDESYQELIYRGAGLTALRQSARSLGMRTMREDGVRKVMAGLTTPGEVISITIADSVGFAHDTSIVGGNGL